MTRPPKSASSVAVLPIRLPGYPSLLAALGEGERAELNALLAWAAHGAAASCGEPADDGC